MAGMAEMDEVRTCFSSPSKKQTKKNCATTEHCWHLYTFYYSKFPIEKSKSANINKNPLTEKCS